MGGVLYGVCAVAGWAAFAYAMFLTHGRWSWPRFATVAAFCAFAVGMTLSIPAVGAAVDGVTGLHELWRLLAHLCVMVIVASAEAQLLSLAFTPDVARRRIRGRVWLSGAAAAALVALYGVASREPTPVDLNVEFARLPAVAAYLLVYLAAFVWYTVDIARLAWRFARITPRPWSRRGLRIAAWGAGFGLLYCLNKVGFLIGYWLGHQPVGEKAATAVLLTLSGPLCVVGFTMPAWGPAVDKVRRWFARRRAHRQLHPLWHDLLRATPDLVLDARFDRDRPPLLRLEYALTRRIVEICDARLDLRQWIPPDAAENCKDPAAAEAARIAAGIAARRNNVPAPRPDRTPIVDPPGGYDGQVVWLVDVARAYAPLRSSGGQPAGSPTDLAGSATGSP